MAVVIAAMGLAASSLAQSPAHPRDREIHDADTLAWWHTTETLSADDMQGRDTGSEAYQRAADYVAERFKAAGLKPAGERNSFFQIVPMHEVAVTPAGTRFALLQADGSETPLAFLEQITIAPVENLPPKLEAALTFRGYCGREAMADIAGRIVVCFGNQREGLPAAGERSANARAGKAVGVINIDDSYFTIEPPRWPAAYARSVKLQAVPGVGSGTANPLAVMRVSAAGAGLLFAGTGQDSGAILKLGGAKAPLPSFDLPARFRASLSLTERDISSPNIVALLPGKDATLRGEYVAVSAHLDGYGFGTAVNGDALYNGTLDDAAYVALLIQMADDIKSHRLPAPKRSILFAAFTGEEKGLLGSTWFVAHPTVPIGQIAADVNLDQLRPLFPLKVLTAEALDETSLGETSRAVASALHIEVRADAEPERNLLHRADQAPFLEAHVPAISFIFGYDPGTDAERRYREWYQVRYHRPQDDLTQPVDFTAAAQFDTFFYRFVHAIANAPVRPMIHPTSSFASTP
jgi:hypothetical protein